ncbi:MAG: signal peptidase I [Bryobacteraceae bacterium]
MQTEVPAEQSETEKATTPKQASRGFVAEWVVTILIMLFASTSLAWSYVIPTGSMEDTLMVGDHIIVDKLAYAPSGTISKYLLPYEDPQHGDVIAFRFPGDISQMFVKRLIGVPGDRIKLVDGRVYRNGISLKEPYVYNKSGYLDPYRDNFPANSGELDVVTDGRQMTLLRDMLEHHVVNGEVVVPPGNYFAMGDNRDNSLDSRYWGFVPRANIVGRPVFIYWSFDAPTDQLMPNSARDFGTHMLDVATHFFSRTRWSRTLQTVRGYPDQQQ